ncbi:MAG: ABC transporter permease [Candidatus Lokiarchaeota archaeon]|nr:ABC transporter permease [Candidatus Lokiarchaeota archaeon]
MSMVKYILRRMLAAIPVLFGVLTITFILSRLMPGNPVLASLPDRFDPADYEAAFIRLGLHLPMINQYFLYIGRLFTGDWGLSYVLAQGQPVWNIVIERFPRTFDIAFASIFIAALIGLKTGVISATNRNKWKDTVLRGFALVGVSIPIFWMGLILQYFLSYQLGWFPTANYKTPGIGDPPVITLNRIIDSLLSGQTYLVTDYIHHLILPVACLSFISIAGITRQTRSSMLEVLEQDYVRTARAKGCKERDVINSHARKNALIPTITVIGLNFGGLLAGAILTETTFNLHGLGEALIGAIQSTDYWLLNAIVFLTTIVFIVINLAIDLIYAFVDPRIRY